MQERTDQELLREYAGQDSEPAFAALVTRHVNLVYSAAVRKTGNPHAAEEITQAVFIILARKAKNLRRETALAGWLYQTTRLTAANFLRGEIRRSRREQEAYMQSLLNEAEVWPHMEPLLEDAMGRLNEKERNAIVLRFFEGKSFQEIGTSVGGSENAAKKRVIHGLEKLRTFFSKRGVSSTTAIIAATISANSVQAAPVALAKSVTAVAIAKGATASASTLTLIKGALKIMAWTKAKTVIVASVAVILTAGITATLVVTHQHQNKAQSDFPKSSWAFAGYVTPEATAQSLFWALKEGNSNAFQAYLNGFTPELRDGLEQEAQKRGANAFAELGIHETGGMTSFRILKKITLSDDTAQLQIQSSGAKGPVQMLLMKKIGSEWKCAGVGK